MEVRNANEYSELNKMLPPPARTFQTREELLNYVRDFALSQGYMVSIKDSSKNRYVTIACDRGGVYRRRLKTEENMRQRKSPSRLTNCPFEVVGKKDDDLWILTVKHGEHNHEPSINISDHPSCRRFTEEEVIMIREMTATGKRPRQILKALRQRNPNLVSDSRNVYNVKAKIRREMFASKKMESPSTSSEVVNMNGIMAAGEPSDRMILNSVEMGESTGQAYLEGDTVKETRTLASELCLHFYTLGWVSGTGGSISIKVHDDSIPKSRQLIVMSPSGIQKERMVPEDIHVLSSEGFVLSTPSLKSYPHNPLKCTDSAPLFLKAHEMRDAGAVIHSHGMESCLVTMIHPFSKEFRITHMEMIKGIKGHGYHDELVVPIIENTAYEGELIESLTEAIRAYPKTTAVLVRNHGVYIWGDSWISAKTQIQSDLEQGVIGAVPVAPDYMGKKMVIDTLAANVEAMIQADRNVAAIKQLQAHIWRTGFQSNELEGIVFGDVREALERWHALGIKVYLYSSGSREAQQLLFANSNYGDLRKYLCGFFDTTIGSKKDTRSYVEILRTVGVDRPADMLFVTDILQEAEAARAAGLEVMISARTGNEHLRENHGYRTIESLLEI